MEWISCDLEMPSPGKAVIVWCSGCMFSGIGWIGPHSREWVIPEPQAIGYESITHWMPLPRPPRA